MKSLASFYHHRIAVVAVDKGTARVEPLAEETRNAGLGGAALGAVLADRHPGSIVFATGPLTGSFAPGSGLLTATFARLEQSGPCAHVALPQGHGAWLRQSGFDALVITGAAPAPRVVRCGKGDAAAAPAPGQCNSREFMRAALLRRTDDGVAGLILADTHAPEMPPAAGGEYGTLPGARLLGAALRARNITAVCLEGGGPLPPMPVPLDNAPRVLCGAAKASGNALHGAFSAEANLPENAAFPFPFRKAACHHCPSPCLGWIGTGKDRHLLVADHAAFAAVYAALGAKTPDCLALCDSLGIDATVAALMVADVPPEDMPDFLRNARPGPAPAKSGPAQSSPAQSSLTQSIQTEPGRATDSSDAMRAGLILGVCPRLIRRFPALGETALAALLGPDAPERLERAGSLLTREVYI